MYRFPLWVSVFLKLYACFNFRRDVRARLNITILCWRMSKRISGCIFCLSLAIVYHKQNTAGLASENPFPRTRDVLIFFDIAAHSFSFVSLVSTVAWFRSKIVPILADVIPGRVIQSIILLQVKNRLFHE